MGTQLRLRGPWRPGDRLIGWALCLCAASVRASPQQMCRFPGNACYFRLDAYGSPQEAYARPAAASATASTSSGKDLASSRVIFAVLMITVVFVYTWFPSSSITRLPSRTTHPSFTMKRARLPCHFEPLISAGSAAIPVIGSSAYAPIRLASSGNCGVCEYSTGNPLNKLCLPSAALQARPICVGIARTSERELPNLTFARHITGRDSRRCGSVPAQSVATARARGHCDAE
jgi:hypothetical protein